MNGRYDWLCNYGHGVSKVQLLDGSCYVVSGIEVFKIANNRFLKNVMYWAYSGTMIGISRDHMLYVLDSHFKPFVTLKANSLRYPQ